MMLYKPALFIQRVSVTANGALVYDQKFRIGINIIRGENGSGKSTISDFIFFVLGGELREWKDAAGRCNWVIAEVLINGEPLTLRREVSAGTQAPIGIFWGAYEEAAVARPEQWALYPLRRSPHKEGFSQVLFRALGLPEVPGEEGSNITMHQVLRLLYSDQMSSVEKIFRKEDYDPALTRDAVGNLLCGAYDADLYSAELRKREAEKELSDVSGELRSLFAVLGGIKHNLNKAWIEQEIRTLLETRAQAEQDLAVSQKERLEKPDAVTHAFYEEIHAEVVRLNKEIGDLEEKLSLANLEMADSVDFIEHCRESLRAIDESQVTLDAMGQIQFQHCPSCFSPIHHTDPDTCPLCKSPKADHMGANMHRVKQELSFQIRESEELLKDKEKRRGDWILELRKKRAERESLGSKLRFASEKVMPESEQRIAALNHRIGYIDRQIEDVNEKGKIIQRIDMLTNKKADLSAEISKLSDDIQAKQRYLSVTRQAVYTRISDTTKEILKKDLPREYDFANCDSVLFSFKEDKLRVNGASLFSASSMVVLKNAFHVAFCMASTSEQAMRYPRFGLFDNIEDKGMELDRSHNFQRIIVELSRQSEVAHQFILTTSMIAPELDVEEYVVGPFYTHENKTLQFKQADAGNR